MLLITVIGGRTVPAFTGNALLLLAVLVRMFGPSLLPGNYRVTILAAGGLWVTAFFTYVAIYTLILVRPRVDGKPG
jgi:uncharacterized protein involved in response to NO